MLTVFMPSSPHHVPPAAGLRPRCRRLDRRSVSSDHRMPVRDRLRVHRGADLYRQRGNGRSRRSEGDSLRQGGERSVYLIQAGISALRTAWWQMNFTTHKLVACGARTRSWGAFASNPVLTSDMANAAMSAVSAPVPHSVDLSFQKIFVMLFLMLGPFKVLSPFVELTATLEPRERTRIASVAIFFSAMALLPSRLARPTDPREL